MTAIVAAVRHTYGLYGLRVSSPWSFPYPKSPGEAADITLVRAPAGELARAREEAAGSLTKGDGAQWATLPDQSVYIEWHGLLAALVAPDGSTIACRSLPGAPRELLHVHLLGPALSFALIRLGMEPLHATVAVVNGRAIALMGDSGYGKSSLGAAFLAAGHRLLTDDLLVLRRSGDRLVAQAGAPRIKLFPAIARHLFGRRPKGTRMSPVSQKLIIPLTAGQRPLGPAPLAAVYVLSPPGPHAGRLSIRRIPPRPACVELVRNTFNMAVTDGPRLARLLEVAGDVLSRVPVKRISYPRRFPMLAAARDAILADLAV